MHFWLDEQESAKDDMAALQSLFQNFTAKVNQSVDLRQTKLINKLYHPTQKLESNLCNNISLQKPCFLLANVFETSKPLIDILMTLRINPTLRTFHFEDFCFMQIFQSNYQECSHNLHNTTQILHWCSKVVKKREIQSSVILQYTHFSLDTLYGVYDDGHSSLW